MTANATPVTVERLRDEDGAWDAFVSAHSLSSYCHLAGWRSVMEDGFGHECLYLVAKDGDGTWRGVLPLVRVKSALFGHYLISVPFLNAGGPLADETAAGILADRALAEAKASGADLVELRTRHPVGAAAFRPSQRKITVHLDLPSTPEPLLKGFHHKLRTNIKKPVRDGAELKVGLDQVDGFYDVYSRNMRDLGTPVLPRKFFERIAAAFPSTVLFAALYLQGAPICGQCSFLWRDTLEMVWGSSVREYNRLKPTTYMHWAFMELAIQRGLKLFDFGRCTPGSGTHVFKSQWGGRDVPLPWLVWSRGAADSPPSPDRPLYRLAASAWSRLPLSVANRAGPILSRFLP